MAGVKTRRTSVTVNGKSVDVAVDELNASGTVYHIKQDSNRHVGRRNDTYETGF